MKTIYLMLCACSLLACAGADKASNAGDAKVGFGQGGTQADGDVGAAPDTFGVDALPADGNSSSRATDGAAVTSTDAKSGEEADEDGTSSDLSDVESALLGDTWDNAGDQWETLSDSMENGWDGEDELWDGWSDPYDGMYYDTDESWWDGSSYFNDGMYDDAYPFYTDEWSYGDAMEEPWDTPSYSDGSMEYPYKLEFPDVTWSEDADSGTACTNCTDACMTATESCKGACNESCVEYCGEDYKDCLDACGDSTPCQATCSFEHGDCLTNCGSGFSFCDSECDEHGGKCAGDCPCEGM